jgi:hypothetical protein
MTPEILGEVSCPSGTVLLIDFGTMHLWQHDTPPLWPAAEGDPDGDGLWDMKIEGRDGARAGAELEVGFDPRFVYDAEEADAMELGRKIADRQRLGYQAWLTRFEPRVPHRQRVNNALEHGGGAGVVPFFAMHAAAVTGLPPGQRLPVKGIREEGGERWAQVTLDVVPGAQAARRIPVGTVMVDCARLMFADVDAVGTWDDESSVDGKADVAFWGRDADGIARHVGAPPLGGDDGTFGFRNLSVSDAERWIAHLESFKQNPDVKFAMDFRPHTPSFFLLEQIRAARTESGILDLGNARVCGFMTTWGDGTFPVFREVDASGRLLRVTVSFDPQ